MDKIQRAYKGKDVDMLTACAAMIEAAIAHKAEIIAKRASWKDPFLADLKTKIETITKTHLGIDSLKDQRQSTQVLLQIQQKALDDLTELHVQIKRDFRKDKIVLNEMLTSLGFGQYYTAAKKKSQADLVYLLYAYKKNLTTQWETDIAAKGVDPALLAGIKGYADALHNANVTQETMKSSGSEISQEAVIDFNEIYAEVMDVANIAQMVFKAKPAIKSKFVYTKTLKALTSMGSTTETKEPDPKPS